MDSMDVEILEDGTISIRTSEISEKNHYSADELLNIIEELSGSKRKTTPIEHTHGKVKHTHHKTISTKG